MASKTACLDPCKRETASKGIPALALNKNKMPVNISILDIFWVKYMTGYFLELLKGITLILTHPACYAVALIICVDVRLGVQKEISAKRNTLRFPQPIIVLVFLL